MVWIVVGLITGQGLGDRAVLLRYEGGSLPAWLARPLRILGGIVGFTLLDALPDPWSLSAAAFVVVALVLLLTTRGSRGLPGVLSGQHVEARGRTNRRMWRSRRGAEPSEA